MQTIWNLLFFSGKKPKPKKIYYIDFINNRPNKDFSIYAKAKDSRDNMRLRVARQARFDRASAQIKAWVAHDELSIKNPSPSLLIHAAKRPVDPAAEVISKEGDDYCLTPAKEEKRRAVAQAADQQAALERFENGARKRKTKKQNVK